MKQYDLGVHLTKGERIAGFCYLPFYVFLVAWGLRLLSRLAGLDLSLAQINLIYGYINFAAIVIIFHRFLAQSLKHIVHSFWPFVQALILGFALYYAVNLALGLLLGWLWPGLENPADDTTIELVRSSGGVMLVCAVFLGPLVEETLMRGLIFGVIQPKNRIAAYAVSALMFAVLHLWQFAGSVSVGVFLGDILLYLPAGLALAWTYEKAGTIWAPIVLHTFINALSLGAIQLLS